jgi:hypothetical protein
MTELVLLVISISLAGLLSRPVVRRLRLPAWFVRARERGRPGIPVSAWLGAVLLMSLAWVVGERRGLPGLILFLIWVGSPLAAGLVTLTWIQARRAGRHR